MQVTPELLSRFTLLKPLPREALEQLAPHAELVRYARRAVALEAGVREGKVCFLFEGRLQGVGFTIDGREVGLYFVEPGDFCGELALFDDNPQPEFVIATTAASVVFVARNPLREAMLLNSSVSNIVGRKLAERVRQMTVQRTLLGLSNIPQRVCGQLYLLVNEAQRKAGSSEIVNPPTHKEIAIMLNLSRETVTRVFQALQSRRIIRRDGPGRLIIADLASLRHFAEGEDEL
ncbi:MAG: Crp/Fnr family transcriptional regulator [Gammaproteobacteria bacterium]|nr:Crp/Fnr family transcriptional regulator [Gammaproteobacteria bacterium]MYH86596.1 Crp/Fnr family transcriptional regulator [Gammaproteobacteria bacterium]